MSIAAVVLAAGSSRRLGRPKQTIVVAGETLLDRAVRIPTEAGLSPVIVVIADASWTDGLQRKGAVVLLNQSASEGIAASIRAGVAGAEQRNATGVVLMTCDQIAVQPMHLRALCTVPGEPAGSGYAGKVGIPAYFPKSSFPALLQLEGDTGARDLLRSARAVSTEDLSLDIDTEEDLERARILFERNGRG